MKVDVVIQHADSMTNLQFEVAGSNGDEIARDVLGQWLRWTAKEYDLDPPEGEEDEPWEVGQVLQIRGCLSFEAIPYRGEGATFLVVKYG